MDNKLNIYLFDDEKITKTLVENYLSSVTFEYNFSQYDNFDESVISQDNTINIIIFCIGIYNIDSLEKLASLSQKPNNKIIIISYDGSTDTNVKSMRTGAAYFMLKPILKSDFINIVSRIYQENTKKQIKNTNASIASVISAEKGAGKTSFIINIAKEIADFSKEKVLIVDFNNAINDVAMMLSLDITYSLPWFINTLNDTNSDEVFDKAFQYKNSNMFIAGSGVLGLKKMPTDLNKIGNFLKNTKRYFKYIFIDLNQDFTEMNNYILENIADKNYILLTPDIISVQRTESLLNLHNELKSINLILNKYNETSGMRLIEAEKMIEKDIFYTLPNNFITTSKALNMKTTLSEINKDMDIVKAYKSLARKIVNREQQ